MSASDFPTSRAKGFYSSYENEIDGRQAYFVEPRVIVDPHTRFLQEDLGPCPSSHLNNFSDDAIRYFSDHFADTRSHYYWIFPLSANCRACCVESQLHLDPRVREGRRQGVVEELDELVQLTINGPVVPPANSPTPREAAAPPVKCCQI